MNNPYTVVILNMDRTDCFVGHVEADNPRAAYEQWLRQIYDETEPEPDLCPFDPIEAERDRPLLAVFAGHLADLAA